MEDERDLEMRRPEANEKKKEGENCLTSLVSDLSFFNVVHSL